MSDKKLIETGMLLAKDGGPDADRVFLTYTITPPWWRFWRRARTVMVMTTGQARTLAAGLNQAVHRLDVKRNGERQIITL